MNQKAKAIIILLTLSLLLFGSGCAEKDKNVPQYTDPSAALVESESGNINSTVDLSLGEDLTVTGKVWQYNVTNVELEVTNIGEEDISIAHAVAIFDNGQCAIRSWDDDEVIIKPGKKEFFYLGSDPRCENLFTNSSVNFRFNLVSTENEGWNQTTIYKGEALIPRMEKGESCDLNITRLTT